MNVTLGGILPFGSIFIEMYFMFTAFWHYKYYYVYGFALLVYIILNIVTICVTIVSTYFLLNSEDYRWQVCFIMVIRFILLVDFFLGRRFYICLCFPLWSLLLLYENQNARIPPSCILFWIYSYVLLWSWNSLR